MSRRSCPICSQYHNGRCPELDKPFGDSVWPSADTNSPWKSDNRNDPSNLRNDRLDDYGKYAQPQKNTYGNTEVKYDSREPALSSSRSSIQHSKRESREPGEISSQESMAFRKNDAPVVMLSRGSSEDRGTYERESSKSLQQQYQSTSMNQLVRDVSKSSITSDVSGSKYHAVKSNPKGSSTFKKRSSCPICFGDHEGRCPTVASVAPTEPTVTQDSNKLVETVDDDRIAEALIESIFEEERRSSNYYVKPSNADSEKSINEPLNVTDVRSSASTMSNASISSKFSSRMQRSCSICHNHHPGPCPAISNENNNNVWADIPSSVPDKRTEPDSIQVRESSGGHSVGEIGEENAKELQPTSQTSTLISSNYSKPLKRSCPICHNSHSGVCPVLDASTEPWVSSESKNNDKIRLNKYSPSPSPIDPSSKPSEIRTDATVNKSTSLPQTNGLESKRFSKSCPICHNTHVGMCPALKQSIDQSPWDTSETYQTNNRLDTSTDLLSSKASFESNVSKPTLNDQVVQSLGNIPLNRQDSLNSIRSKNEGESRTSQSPPKTASPGLNNNPNMIPNRTESISLYDTIRSGRGELNKYVPVNEEPAMEDVESQLQRQRGFGRGKVATIPAWMTSSSQAKESLSESRDPRLSKASLSPTKLSSNQQLSMNSQRIESNHVLRRNILSSSINSSSSAATGFNVNANQAATTGQNISQTDSIRGVREHGKEIPVNADKDAEDVDLQLQRQRGFGRGKHATLPSWMAHSSAAKEALSIPQYTSVNPSSVNQADIPKQVSIDAREKISAIQSTQDNAQVMKCGVCGGDDQNEMEKCCHCPVATHVECRGSAGIYAESGWICPRCYAEKENITSSTCTLCLKDIPTLLLTRQHRFLDSWVHPICQRAYKRATATSLCEICRKRDHFNVRCAVKDCSIAIHPTCCFQGKNKIFSCISRTTQLNLAALHDPELSVEEQFFYDVNEFYHIKFFCLNHSKTQVNENDDGNMAAISPNVIITEEGEASSDSYDIAIVNDMGIFGRYRGKARLLVDVTDTLVDEESLAIKENLKSISWQKSIRKYEAPAYFEMAKISSLVMFGVHGLDEIFESILRRVFTNNNREGDILALTALTKNEDMGLIFLMKNDQALELLKGLDSDIQPYFINEIKHFNWIIYAVKERFVDVIKSRPIAASSNEDKRYSQTLESRSYSKQSSIDIRTLSSSKNTKGSSRGGRDNTFIRINKESPEQVVIKKTQRLSSNRKRMSDLEEWPEASTEPIPEDSLLNKFKMPTNLKPATAPLQRVRTKAKHIEPDSTDEDEAYHSENSDIIGLDHAHGHEVHVENTNDGSSTTLTAEALDNLNKIFPEDISSKKYSNRNKETVQDENAQNNDQGTSKIADKVSSVMNQNEDTPQIQSLDNDKVVDVMRIDGCFDIMIERTTSNQSTDRIGNKSYEGVIKDASDLSSDIFNQNITNISSPTKRKATDKSEMDDSDSIPLSKRPKIIEETVSNDLSASALKMPVDVSKDTEMINMTVRSNESDSSSSATVNQNPSHIPASSEAELILNDLNVESSEASTANGIGDSTEINSAFTQNEERQQNSLREEALNVSVVTNEHAAISEIDSSSSITSTQRAVEHDESLASNKISDTSTETSLNMAITEILTSNCETFSDDNPSKRQKINESNQSDIQPETNKEDVRITPSTVMDSIPADGILKDVGLDMKKHNQTFREVEKLIDDILGYNTQETQPNVAASNFDRGSDQEVETSISHSTLKRSFDEFRGESDEKTLNQEGKSLNHPFEDDICNLSTTNSEDSLVSIPEESLELTKEELESYNLTPGSDKARDRGEEISIDLLVSTSSMNVASFIKRNRFPERIATNFDDSDDIIDETILIGTKFEMETNMNEDSDDEELILHKM